MESPIYSTTIPGEFLLAGADKFALTLNVNYVHMLYECYIDIHLNVPSLLDKQDEIRT